MEFFNTPFLFALAAAAVPILIHLIHRRKSKVISFSTLLFLRQIDRRIARRHRIREFFILVLRAAVLSFLALALARPMLLPKGIPMGRRPPMARVLVVDDSLSTRRVEMGRSIFEKNRTLGLLLLEDLQPDDAAALLFTSSDGGEEKAALLRRCAPLLARLRNHVPTFGKGNPAEVLQTASRLLAAAPFPLKEILVLTDLQASEWRESLEALRTEHLFKDNHVQFLVSPVPVRTDLAVTKASVIPAGGERSGEWLLEGEVRNFSPQKGEGLLSLFLNGVKVREEPVSVPSEGSVPVNWRVKSKEAEAVRGALCLSSDILPENNTRFFIIPAKSHYSVLLFRKDPVPSLWNDPAFFIVRALDPMEEGKGAGVEIDRVDETNLDTRTLGEYDVVLLLDPPAYGPELKDSLEEYVKEGGALLLFSRPETNPEALAEVLGELLPAVPEGTVSLPLGKPFSLEPADPDHPVLRSLASLQPPLNWDGPKFLKIMRLSLSQEGKSRVLLRFRGEVQDGRGSPALVEGTLGKGRVLLFAFSADLSGADLPIRIPFVPMVRSFCAYLAQESQNTQELEVGSSLERRYPEDTPVRKVALLIQCEAGAGLREESSLPVPAGGRSLPLHLGEVLQPGIYCITETSSDEKREEWFLAHIPQQENEPSPLSFQAVEAILPGTALHGTGEAGELPPLPSAEKKGVDLMIPLCFLVLALLLLEGSLSSLRKKRTMEKRAEEPGRMPAPKEYAEERA